ncbi:MAG: SDR family NAD(P)-dependent oxidoreductase [Anaerolineae bacterium]
MLDGKVAWVTGATGGLGPAIVRTLLEAGATVVATGRHGEEFAQLTAQSGAPGERWLALPLDLTDFTAVKAAVDTILQQLGRIDILVAVAGGWRGGQPVTDIEPETLDWLWRINMVTAFNACKAVLPAMLAQRWGRIITVSARSALGGQPRNAAYAASKAALLAFTQSLAAETRQVGITANTVLLSTIDTPANRAAMPTADHSQWVAPEQIAAAVRFLCSEEAAAISGAAIPIYGQA